MLALSDLALDPDQYQAARSKGHTLVLAGPGAGKTRTLLGRVLHLLEEGVPADKIYLLTFTLKAVGELQKRLQKMGVQGVQVHTFHALAYRLCRQKGLSPKLISPEEQKTLLKEVYKSLGYPISGRRKWDPLSTHKHADPKILETYKRALKAHGLWDYQRLLEEAQGHGLSHEGLHLLVDEFQDLNAELVTFLEGFKGATLFLVGDPAQAIYGFRGASPEVVAAFVKGLAGLQIKVLGRSYRVPREILAWAEKLRDQTVFPSTPLRAVKEGGNLQGFWLSTPNQEGTKIANLVRELLGGLQMEHSSVGWAPHEVAIVARTKALLKPIQEALYKFGVPAVTYTETQKSFCERLEQFMALLEKGPLDNLEQIREKLLQKAHPQLLWKDLLPEVQYLLRISEDVSEFFFNLEWARKTPSLVDPLDTLHVPLLTIHETKGLEFKVVILAGAEEGLLPLSVMPDSDEREEMRLAYVALTRAGESFYFTGVSKRMIFGKKLPGRPSRYFLGLPVEKSIPPKKTSRQKSLFS